MKRVIILLVICAIAGVGLAQVNISKIAETAAMIAGGGESQEDGEKPDMKDEESGEDNKKKDSTDPLSEERIREMVVPSRVEGEITKETKVYSNYESSSKIMGKMDRDTTVEVIKDRSSEWYYVEEPGEELKGWVPQEAISIEKAPPAIKERMSREQLEKYVNMEGLKSETEYLVWVDIARQLTYVFNGRRGEWELERIMPCATGENKSPTVRGEFTIEERGEWFYSERFESGAENWVRFYGPYLFHSVSMDRQGNVIDSTLGERASNGCIRLSVEDSEWFYENIPRDTKVFIY